MNMTKWFRTLQTKHQEKQRQRILRLIGRDIEDIARDAYQEGCYVTAKRKRLEKEMEFRQLMAQNEKLTELMLERNALDIPEFITPEA